MKILTRLAATLILCLLLAGPSFEPARADISMGWAPDARVPGYLEDTFPPLLVADHNRTVHAFASQWVENKGRRRAIVYRQWTVKGGWTRPVDILLAPEGDAALLGVFLDASDVVHMLVQFRLNDYPAIYYTYAPIEDAASAGAWALPIMLGGPMALDMAAISGDEQGHLAVIFSANIDGTGVYGMESSDSGDTWTRPAPLYLTYDSDLVANTLRLTPASHGQIRAAWSVVTSLGVDKLLYYADYDIQEEAWSNPLQLDQQINIQDYFGPSFPAIVDTGKQIVIMYNSGNPFTDRPVKPGRPVQQVFLSNDDGKSWSSPAVPFPYHLGRSGEHALVLDSAGIPHALFIQRIEEATDQGTYSAIAGVWHSAFKAGTWTNPERFVTTYTPHDLHAVMSQGNVLLVTWREDPGAGKHGIWFSYSILDAPELPVVPLATPSLNTAAAPTPTPVYAVETPTRLPQDMLEGSSPSNWQTNPAFPLIAGILPVILIVVGVLAVFHFLPNHHE